MATQVHNPHSALTKTRRQGDKETRRWTHCVFFSLSPRLLVSLSFFLACGCDNNIQWPTIAQWPTSFQKWPSQKPQVPLTEPTEVASAADQRAAAASDATTQRAPSVSAGNTQPPPPQPVAQTDPAPAAATPATKPAYQADERVADPADNHPPIRPAGITVTKAGATATPANSRAGQSGPMALTDLNNPPPRQTVVISPGAVTVTTNPSALPPTEAPAGADSRPSGAPAPTSRPAATPDDGHARIITAPMVQVNGRYISVDDVYRGAYERAEGISTLTSKRDYTLAIKKIVQDELNVRIHDCLIIGEAEKKLADEEKTQIDKEMEDTLADMIADAGTKAKLQDRYTQRGLTLEDVLKDQRQRITIRAYLRSHFSSELVVGRKTLYEYFTSHKGEFSTPLKVQMQIISSPADAFLPKDLDGREASPAELKVAKEDARRNIELAAKALGEGKDFDQVAKTHSKDAHAKDGGVWPTMPKGSLKESKLEEAAFTQKEGQVSGIIPTDTGYYLVKTRKIQGASEQTFEAVQDKIEARLKDENYRKVTEQYLTKVYEGATISRTDDLIEAVCLRLMNTFSKP